MKSFESHSNKLYYGSSNSANNKKQSDLEPRNAPVSHSSGLTSKEVEPRNAPVSHSSGLISKEVEVWFGTKKIINGEYVKLSDVQSKPIINFDHMPGEHYTIMMVDPDAPSKTNHIYRHWLHMLIIDTDKEIVSFNASDPPAGSGPHRYYICLFRQKNKLESIPIPPRKKFNVTNFIKQYGLTLVASKMYVTERI